MTSLDSKNYAEVTLVYSGGRTMVYRGIRVSDRQPVIVKVLRNQHPTFNELVKFRNQYAIASHLEHPGIVQPLALERCNLGYALVMPDEGAISLGKYWQHSHHSLSEFLILAIQLADTLDYLNQQRIIHKDIKPSNILIHPQTHHVQLIDFSIASLLPKEQQQLMNPHVLEGTLAYISPEQTGRMNRGIDYRSDFYSLGVTFFELLTGELPFKSDDPMELVHCHLAKMPAELGSRETIPQVLSDIVLKLMAKNAEDRYQSALGLKYDLEQCLQEWQATGEIAGFAIGQRDVCDRFLIPEKLYGREQEVQILLESFERVSFGETEMMLVAGFSGIGKTAVINEIHKPIVRQRGYFIQGKFDQFNRNIPFSALVQAFQELIEQLLGDSDVELATWKAKILQAVGENGQVIVDIIPELEQIIGQQPPVQELSGSAAQNRFNLLFSQFIGVFTTQEHPLVIFLDDLQWADYASLNLLKLLMGDSEAGYLLLLGAYRDNEVFPAHPLMLTLEEIKKQGITPYTLTLNPLGKPEIAYLVADTLRCSAEVASPLADFIYQKTKGNPFFTTQFLKGLHDDGSIEFNVNVGSWQCDMSKVRQLTLTDDVVGFMMGRLQKLSPTTQEMIKIAACIGNKFNLKILALAGQRTPEETAVHLWSSLAEGFILPESDVYKFYLHNSLPQSTIHASNPCYRFLHDRVQQAAYSLIEEDQRKQTHLEIGCRLWEHLDTDVENVFEIVDHLNRAEELIGNRAQRDEIAQLNLLAAQKAKSTTAYAAAREYANAGRSFLGENSWSTQYDLTLALYIATLESEFLSTNFEGIERLAEIVLQRAKTLLDRVEVYNILIQADISQNKMQNVIDSGLKVLEMLEITLSDDPRDQINNLQQLIDLPEMTDPYKLAAMDLLTNIITTAWMVNPELLKQITFTMVDLSLTYGNCSSSIVGYGWYSMLLCEGFGDLELGYQLGELSVQLMERFNTSEIKSQVLNIVAGGSRLWKQHPKQCIELELEGIKHGLESGDFECASYAAAEYCHFLFLMGENLGFVSSEFQKYKEMIERLKQDYHLDYIATWQQTIQNLQGNLENPTQLFRDNSQGELQRVHKLIDENQPVLVYHYHLLKMMLSYLFKDYLNAVENAILIIPETKENGNNLFSIPAIFYSSLALLAGVRESGLVETEHYLGNVEQNLLQMEYWAKFSPLNYQHQCDLIQAEQARNLGQKWEAVEFYKRARVGAKEGEYLHHEAIACELTAEFYFEQEMPEVAEVYLIDAYYAYAHWGAQAKVADLEQRYSQVLAPILNSEIRCTKENFDSSRATSLHLTSTSSGANIFLDFSSAIKTSQALSGEMNLEQLLAKLIQSLIENAGATKGALLLPKQESLWIEAIADYIDDASNIQIRSLARSLPLASTQELPLTIINRVWRTRETLVLNHSIEESRFSSDEYLSQSLPKSILCLALQNQGKLIAILYLENKLTTGTFTSDRLEILKLIGTQATISLENARLYQQLEDYSHNLEEKVEQRTQELQENNQQLEQTLQQLQQTQAQLIQTEKMSSLGQMVAGIAHEINNPINFIFGNIMYARQYVQDLLDLVSLYEQHSSEVDAAIAQKLEEIELDYLRLDIESLFNSMQAGSDRIHKIIQGLRNFARLDQSKYKKVDIHEGLENTLLILNHRLKAQHNRPEIKILKNYSSLPLIHCSASQLNQVFLNLLTNAIDALEKNPLDRYPTIHITTTILDAQRVQISIQDNGSGMSKTNLQKAFDPFFTTKPVGQGTGLGLSTSYQIITQQHRGQLRCVSQPREGTELIIEIPI